MNLEQTLGKAVGLLRSGQLDNEAQVKQAVVLPILRALGWDNSDPEAFKTEYPAGSGRVSARSREQRGIAEQAAFARHTNNSGNEEILQDIVYDLIRVVLEIYPGLLDEETIHGLKNEKNSFGTKLGYPLIRKISGKREISVR